MRLIHRADVQRVTRGLSAGHPANTVQQIVTGLPCLLESTQPKSLAMSSGWIERASYVVTWVDRRDIRAGDYLIHNGKRHVIKTVREDLQGRYFTAILEAEAK
jgi:hypothetical protein